MPSFNRRQNEIIDERADNQPVCSLQSLLRYSSTFIERVRNILVNSNGQTNQLYRFLRLIYLYFRSFTLNIHFSTFFCCTISFVTFLHCSHFLNFPFLINICFSCFSSRPVYFSKISMQFDARFFLFPHIRCCLWNFNAYLISMRPNNHGMHISQ